VRKHKCSIDIIHTWQIGFEIVTCKISMACYVKGHSGKHVMSTTEPEAHNVMHCHQMRTEPQPQVMCIDNNIVEFRHAVLEMSLQTDTHTHTHTQTHLVAVLAPVWRQSNNP